jgi:hypothetical protein
MTQTDLFALIPVEPPPAPTTEEEKRDAVLDHLASLRADLVRLAREAALRLAHANGSVTSSDVLRELRATGHGPAIDSVDRRFMGVVFRDGWERTGWVPDGSHSRPIAVWRRR